MFQHETQPENHLERSKPLPLQPASQDAEQRKRLLIALGILLVALAVVVLKDWDWFRRAVKSRKPRFEARIRVWLRQLRARRRLRRGNASQPGPSPRHPLRPKFPSRQALSAQRYLPWRWKS